MFRITRLLAVAAILPLLAACSADFVIPDGQRLASMLELFRGSPDPSIWVLSILVTAHVGVALRCRAMALRVRHARARRRDRNRWR